MKIKELVTTASKGWFNQLCRSRNHPTFVQKFVKEPTAAWFKMNQARNYYSFPFSYLKTWQGQLAWSTGTGP